MHYDSPHLPGIDSAGALSRSPFSGAIFEGFVASEIVKQQLNSGRRRALYFFRDQRGLEVDFIVPADARELVLIKAKASRTVYPDAARSALSLALEHQQSPRLACEARIRVVFPARRGPVNTTAGNARAGPFRVAVSCLLMYRIVVKSKLRL